MSYNACKMQMCEIQLRCTIQIIVYQCFFDVTTTCELGHYNRLSADGFFFANHLNRAFVLTSKNNIFECFNDHGGFGYAIWQFE